MAEPEQATDSSTPKERRRRGGSLLLKISRGKTSRSMTAIACAAVCMWLVVHVSAFASVPSFSTPHQLRPSNRHPTVMLLQGGGLQGNPAQADQEHSSGTEGVDLTDEGASNVRQQVAPPAVQQ